MAAPYMTAAQVGSYFVTQYYQMLQSRPDFIHQLYSDASSMIRIDGRNRDTGAGMMQIHALVMSLRFGTIEITTAHSLESWSGGVIVMVTGSVKMRDLNGRKKFAQTFFLAPQEKGYFVLNDIFHFIDEEQIHSYPVTQLGQSNLNTKMNHSPSLPQPVPNYMMGGSEQAIAASDIKENDMPDLCCLPHQMLQNERREAGSMSKGTSFFRQAGLSYLQYVNKSAGVLREALKEPVKSKVLHRNKVEFAAFKWADGERGKRVDVDSIKKAAEAFAKSA